MTKPYVNNLHFKFWICTAVNGEKKTSKLRRCVGERISELVTLCSAASYEYSKLTYETITHSQKLKGPSVPIERHSAPFITRDIVFCIHFQSANGALFTLSFLIGVRRSVLRTKSRLGYIIGMLLVWISVHECVCM